MQWAWGDRSDGMRSWHRGLESSSPQWLRVSVERAMCWALFASSTGTPNQFAPSVHAHTRICPRVYIRAGTHAYTHVRAHTHVYYTHLYTHVVDRDPISRGAKPCGNAVRTHRVARPDYRASTQFSYCTDYVVISSSDILVPSCSLSNSASLAERIVMLEAEPLLYGHLCNMATSAIRAICAV